MASGYVMCTAEYEFWNNQRVCKFCDQCILFLDYEVVADNKELKNNATAFQSNQGMQRTSLDVLMSEIV